LLFGFWMECQCTPLRRALLDVNVLPGVHSWTSMYSLACTPGHQCTPWRALLDVNVLPGVHSVSGGVRGRAWEFFGVHGRALQPFCPRTLKGGLVHAVYCIDVVYANEVPAIFGKPGRHGSGPLLYKDYIPHFFQAKLTSPTPKYPIRGVSRGFGGEMGSR
jgi:hypothetical protein